MSIHDYEDEDLHLQCDVFYEGKAEDDDMLAEGVSGDIDINSHTEVFNTIFHRVSHPYTNVTYIVLWGGKGTHVTNAGYCQETLAPLPSIILKRPLCPETCHTMNLDLTCLKL